MYFEEKIIEGILCFRSSPNGAWQAYSREELTKRVGNYHSLQDSLFLAHDQADYLFLALVGENSDIEPEDNIHGLLDQILGIIIGISND